MDGTFIPLDGNQDNVRDLLLLQAELELRSIDLVYVTGRDYRLVQSAIRSHLLPTPTWIICDVGTTIYVRDLHGKHELLEAYRDHLAEIVDGTDAQTLSELLAGIPNMRKQEQEKQGQFKLSYYADVNELDEVAEQIELRLTSDRLPYELLSSVDPFTGQGLIDLLPTSISKAYALAWWALHTKRDNESIVFAGDSGNDFAALTAGYRSILVGNALPTVVFEVRNAHKRSDWLGRLHVAAGHATSGVLEGLKHFLASG
jgi:HAD superfamily hydrolase (TIGR01484 family)